MLQLKTSCRSLCIKETYSSKKANKLLYVHFSGHIAKVYKNILLNIVSLNCACPLICSYFSTNTQLALYIPRFFMHGFNQLLMGNSIFNPRLGICDLAGLTICIISCHLCKISAFMDFGLFSGVLEPIPHGY